MISNRYVRTRTHVYHQWNGRLCFTFTQFNEWFTRFYRGVLIKYNGLQQQTVLVAKNGTIFIYPIYLKKCNTTILYQTFLLCFIFRPWNWKKIVLTNISVTLNFKPKTLFKFLTGKLIGTIGQKSHRYFSNVKANAVFLKWDNLCSKRHQEINLTEIRLTKKLIWVGIRMPWRKDFWIRRMRSCKTKIRKNNQWYTWG